MWSNTAAKPKFKWIKLGNTYKIGSVIVSEYNLANRIHIVYLSQKLCYELNRSTVTFLVRDT